MDSKSQNIKFGKLDHFLIGPFLAFHYRHGFIREVTRFPKTILLPAFKRISMQPQALLRIIYYIATSLGVFLLTTLYVPIYLLIYIIYAFFASLLTFIVSLGVGLFYGILPFLLSAKPVIKPTRKPSNAFNNKRWVGFLLAPLDLSLNFSIFNHKKLIEVATRPFWKILSFDEKEETNIVLTIGFSIAGAFSIILYAFISTLGLSLIVDLILLIISLICLTLYFVLSLFDYLARMVVDTFKNSGSLNVSENQAENDEKDDEHEVKENE